MKHFLFCLLLAGIAILPIFLHTGLPAGADVSIHYWRVVDLENTWNYGDLSARWSELYYYGYGAPAFQYTAGGFYALAVLVGKLPFVNDVTRIKLIWSLGIFLGTYGIFLYVSRRWGVRAGYVSAAAFTFAPALIFNEPLARGSFGVVFGMGCMALALAYLDRILYTGRGFFVAILAMFGLLLSHNLTAIAGMAVLAGYLILESGQAPHWKIGWSAFFLACSLSAFFWIPVGLERNFVRVSSMGTNEHLDWRRYFVGLKTLLQPLQAFDVNLANNSGHQQIGLVQWLLAIGALLGFNRHKRLIAFWIAVALSSIILITPFSIPLWERIPVLQIFLFPLRFLNIAIFALAILCGIAVHRWWHVQLFWLMMLTLLVAQGLYSIGWEWRDFPAEATASDYIQYELETNILGGTADNEFLPLTVRDIPSETGFIVDNVGYANRPTQRVNPFSYPSARMLETSPTQTSFTIDLETAQTVEVLQFAFPNWRATVNDEPLDIRPSTSFGFILLDLPAGEHNVHIWYPLTMPQWIGISLSVLSLCLVIFGWIYLRKFSNLPISHPDSEPINSLHFLIVLAVLYGLSLASFGGYWGVSASSANNSQSAENKLLVEYEDITLLGYDFVEPYPQQIWRVELFWDFQTDIEVNSFVHLLDSNNSIVAQVDKLSINVNASDNLLWRDTYTIVAEVPAEVAHIRVGLWQCLDEQNSFDCINRQAIPIINDPYINPDGWVIISE